jgi:hypothetical protein
MKAIDKKVSAFIRVHTRFLNDVIFQTGLTGFTGYVFNPVYPVILSNSKCQFTYPLYSAGRRLLLNTWVKDGWLVIINPSNRRYLVSNLT